jgi:hypothetical protein
MSKVLSSTVEINTLAKWHTAFISTVVCLVVLITSPLAGAASGAGPSHCADYARYATGIDIIGSPKDWDNYAARYGYYLSDAPVTGGVISFEPGAYGADGSYGFVGVVSYYKDDGNYWKVGVRYADAQGQAAGQYYYTGVYEKEYRLLKGDPSVHYVYRDGRYYEPKYYACPEYPDAGQAIISRQYAFPNRASYQTVYSYDRDVVASIASGRMVRVLARAEVGETMWVFVESSRYPGVYYAKTSLCEYGKDERLEKFNPHSPASEEMYYAKAYGDTLIDLGYGDYSKLAGHDGKVTITVKKGGNVKSLQTVQTITLQLKRN